MAENKTPSNPSARRLLSAIGQNAGQKREERGEKQRLGEMSF
jgi:hypothetical protein